MWNPQGLEKQQQQSCAPLLLEKVGKPKKGPRYEQQRKDFLKHFVSKSPQIKNAKIISFSPEFQGRKLADISWMLENYFGQKYCQGHQGLHHAVALRILYNEHCVFFPLRASSFFQKCDPGNNGLCVFPMCFLIFPIWSKTVTLLLSNFTKEDLRMRKKSPPSSHSQKVAKGQVGRQRRWQKVSQQGEKERESRPNRSKNWPNSKSRPNRPKSLARDFSVHLCIHATYIQIHW